LFQPQQLCNSLAVLAVSANNSRYLLFMLNFCLWIWCYQSNFS